MSASAGGIGFAVDEQGDLPDGTPWRVTLPRSWNGIVVRDLDYVFRSQTPGFAERYEDLWRRGFAVIGTMRHRLRMYQYDPLREIANLDRVLDRFETVVGGRDHRVLQYGCSGGGHVTLAVSEFFADRVHGCVALAAHTPVALMNTFLDGWFVLRTLIGPAYVEAGHGALDDLGIVGLANDGLVDPTGHGRTGPIVDAWRRAVETAQATAIGRARIALAFALAQWPAWMTDDVPQPDLDDPFALQFSMYRALVYNAANPGGEARIMFENAAQGQQLSWNTDADYAAYLETANPSLRAATEALYAAAGSDLRDDLLRLSEAPRVTASPYALDFWRVPGRTTFGKPRIPVLRLHMIGDYQIPPSLVEGYEAEVAASGATRNFRSAYVRATGHCNFSAAESAAAVETVLQRAAGGDWPEVDPAAMNAHGEFLAVGSKARFTDYAPYRHPRYNRTWRPG